MNAISFGSKAQGRGEIHLPASDRSKHMLVVGATGTGKSKFLERLIRQDIAEWPQNECGMMVIDPHGNLFDSVMQWLARNRGVLDVPVIPIDFRQDDWIVSYNVLRKRRQGDPAVAIRQLVDAMAHVWGQSGTDSTPLFGRWASNLLQTLYANSGSLLDSYALLDQYLKHIRLDMLRPVTNDRILRDWRSVHNLSSKDFEAQIGSLVNRLHRFLETDLIRHMLGGSEHSLDLRESLDAGYIILVCLGTENGYASDEDTQLMATLLLTDLWSAAKERGKREGLKPFRLFIDEFQNFLVPTIAKNLDQARGFGLQLHLSHQFPNQLLNGGEHGKAIYDSVLVNARTKVVFQVQGEENLKPLAQSLFMGLMDPNKIKHQLFATRVVDHAVVDSTTTTKTDGESSSDGESESRTRPDRYHDYEQGYQEHGYVLEGDESSPAYPSATTGRNVARARSASRSESTSSMIMPILGMEEASRQYESLDEQLFRGMQAIAALPERHFIVKAASAQTPEMCVVPNVVTYPVDPQDVEEHTHELMTKWPFILPRESATKRIRERAQYLMAAPGTFVGEGEPTTAKRKLLA